MIGTARLFPKGCRICSGRPPLRHPGGMQTGQQGSINGSATVPHTGNQTRKKRHPISHRRSPAQAQPSVTYRYIQKPGRSSHRQESSASGSNRRPKSFAVSSGGGKPPLVEVLLDASWKFRCFRPVGCAECRFSPRGGLADPSPCFRADTDTCAALDKTLLSQVFGKPPQNPFSFSASGRVHARRNGPGFAGASPSGTAFS